ncbi:MAG: class I SAM-dependent methyltransferase [Anaerolineae bacterium]|nr:class I SAM-dependent methyltransferase [Gloeobacterales cyanobacterium ES-bin-313]
MEKAIQGSQVEGYYQNQRPEMLPFIPAGAKCVLEVGCGEGGFSQLVKSQLSAETWGVEIDERAAKAASKKLDRVLCQSFNSGIELPHHYFDCIIFNDVLEHLVDPFAALDFSRQLLNSKGVVVCSIPNIRYFHILVELLFEAEWRYRNDGILDRTHLRFFTERSIKRTFDELGYHIERIEGLHPSPSWKYRLVNTLLLGRIADMGYTQFAVVARPRN